MKIIFLREPKMEWNRISLIWKIKYLEKLISTIILNKDILNIFSLKSRTRQTEYKHNSIQYCARSLNKFSKTNINKNNKKDERRKKKKF